MHSLLRIVNWLNVTRDEEWDTKQNDYEISIRDDLILTRDELISFKKVETELSKMKEKKKTNAVHKIIQTNNSWDYQQLIYCEI